MIDKNGNYQFRDLKEIEEDLFNRLNGADVYGRKKIIRKIKDAKENYNSKGVIGFNRVIYNLTERLKEHDIDSSSALALEFLDPNSLDPDVSLLFQELTQRRVDELFAGKEESDSPNCGYFAVQLMEKMRNINGLKRVVNHYLENGRYYSAKKTAGVKYKIDRDIEFLNRVTSFSAMEDIVTEKLTEDAPNLHISIYYSPDEDLEHEREDVLCYGVIPHFTSKKEFEKTEKYLEEFLKTNFGTFERDKIGSKHVGKVVRQLISTKDENGKRIYGYSEVMGKVYSVEISSYKDYRIVMGHFDTTIYEVSDKDPRSEIIIGGRKIFTSTRRSKEAQEAKELRERLFSVRNELSNHLNRHLMEEIK